MTDKITIDRSLLQQALDALQRMTQPVKTNDETAKHKAVKNAITALREALVAQPASLENTFDSWCKNQYEYNNWYFQKGGTGDMAVPFARKAWEAGFAATQQPQHQPLTDEQIDAITKTQWGDMWERQLSAHRAYAREIEAAHFITGETK